MLSPQSTLGSLTPNTDAPFTALVTSDEARFVFPVSTQPEWEWFAVGTKGNALEYQWQIEVRNGKSTCQFGFTLFKYPGRKAERGALENLLQSGQTGMWQVQQSGGSKTGSFVPDAGVKIVSVPGAMIVLVQGEENVRRMFSDKPAKVTFLIALPGEKEIRKKVKVSYR